MIVRLLADTIELITQPDHAHLSRAIMEQCVPLRGHTRRESILHAIGEHDNGWREEDAAPTVDPATGEIHDFVSAPAATRQDVWPRGVTRLSKDPWTAALVAQHAITVYDRFRDDSAWTRFFANMESLRDTMVRASGMPLDDLIDDYQYVRLGDLISLVFCTGWTDEHHFGRWPVRRLRDRVVVPPDLFADAAVAIVITATQIRRRPFRSNVELHEALRSATSITLHGEVGGASDGR